MSELHTVLLWSEVRFDKRIVNSLTSVREVLTDVKFVVYGLLYVILMHSQCFALAKSEYIVYLHYENNKRYQKLVQTLSRTTLL